MTTPKAKLAGLARIAAMCAGFTLGPTACTDERARTGAETPSAEADIYGGLAPYKQGDYATALRELRPLAEQGDANAQLLVGFMYDRGLGVPQDYAEAAKWYRKAAGQGLVEAQDYLGFMYYKGQGVPQDYTQAHMWLNLAASSPPETDDDRRNTRDRAHTRLNIVAHKMTPAQIAEAQKLAREWRPKK